jgi:hypothetical protein
MPTPPLLAGDVEAGLFAVSEEVRIVADLLEPDSLAQGGKIIVIGMGQRVSQIHFSQAGQMILGFRLDGFLAEPGQRDRYLNCGAGLKSAAERQFLVDDGQHAAGLRIGHQHRPVVIAERLDRGAPDDQIVAIDGVASRRIGISRLSPGTAGNDRTGDGRPGLHRDLADGRRASGRHGMTDRDGSSRRNCCRMFSLPGRGGAETKTAKHEYDCENVYGPNYGER